MKHATKGKGRTGPGGIRCACCTKGLPRDVKRETARYNRRKAKKGLAQWSA